MNILYINHYAGSPKMGMEFRPYYLAKEWVNMGHNVTIISSTYSHLRKNNPIISRDFESEIIDGITYLWVKAGTYKSNGAKRALSMFIFVWKLLLHSSKLAKTIAPNVVIASSTYPLDIYPAKRISDKANSSLIHEVHDMWPISPIEIGGMSPKHPFIKIMQRAENYFCKYADNVVSLLPAAKNYFVEHGMQEEKFRYVPNGVVLEEWENYKKIPSTLRDHFLNNKKKGLLNLCFFGSIRKTYNLDLLIEAVKARQEKQDLALTLIGSGYDQPELEKMANGFEDIIKFFDPIPKTSIPDLFNYIDSTFVGAKNQKIFRFGIAMNKLFDSMMGGKPILYMVDAPNNFIEDYNCGVVVNGSNLDALSSGIDTLLALSDTVRTQLGQNGKRAAMTKFNYKSIAKQFYKIMEEAVNEKNNDSSWC